MSNNEQQFYNLHEVSTLTGVRPYVLRFWFSEFSHLTSHPEKAIDQSKYTKDDLDLIKNIKKLLFEDKLSIQEAKVHLVKNMDNRDEPITKQVHERKDENVFVQQKFSTNDNLQEANKIINDILADIDLIKKDHNWLN